VAAQPVTIAGLARTLFASQSREVRDIYFRRSPDSPIIYGSIAPTRSRRNCSVPLIGSGKYAYQR
jgi:hypothetical protein